MAPSGEARRNLKRNIEPKEAIVPLFQNLCEDDQHLFRLLVRGMIEESDEAAILSPYLELPAASQSRPRLSLVRYLSGLCDEDLRQFDAALQNSDIINLDDLAHDAGDRQRKKSCHVADCGESADQILHVLSSESGEELCSLELSPSMTLHHLQNFIADSIKVPSFLQRLSLGGVILQSGMNPFEQIVRTGSPNVMLERLDPARVAVLPCLARGEGSLCELEEKFCRDREMVLAAVQGNGMELRFAAEELQKDREIALMAVRKNGHALEFVAAELKRDREVVLEAVKERGVALQFAAKELRADYGVALAAVQRDAEAVQYVADQLKVDQRIARAAVAGGGLECFFDANFMEEALNMEESRCDSVVDGASLGLYEGTDILATSDAYQ